MRQTTNRRRSVRLAASILTVGAALAGPASAVAPAANCAAADRSPTALTGPGVRHAVLCVLNQERTARGLGRLRHDRRLGKAALRHSREMVSGHYFAHDSRSGASFADRIQRTGWTRGRRCWAVGENLAWGAGPLATPRAIAAAWMRSPGHRRNILDGRFHQIGIGVVRAAPLGGARDGATYTTDFGS